MFSAELNFKIRLDAKSNVTLKFKKAFWRSVLRWFLLHFVRNAKATNVVQSNLIKTRHLVCEINFKIKLNT